MGIKRSGNTSPMERELNYLLTDLCVIWGFCIPAQEHQEIIEAENYDANQFARDVVTAEGMNEDFEIKWVKRIAERFKERFGASYIESTSFVDRVRGTKENWQH